MVDLTLIRCLYLLFINYRFHSGTKLLRVFYYSTKLYFIVNQKPAGRNLNVKLVSVQPR